jgi:hypothetical protein
LGVSFRAIGELAFVVEDRFDGGGVRGGGATVVEHETAEDGVAEGRGVGVIIAEAGEGGGHAGQPLLLSRDIQIAEGLRSFGEGDLLVTEPGFDGGGRGGEGAGFDPPLGLAAGFLSREGGGFDDVLEAVIAAGLVVRPVIAMTTRLLTTAAILDIAAAGGRTALGVGVIGVALGGADAAHDLLAAGLITGDEVATGTEDEDRHAHGLGLRQIGVPSLRPHDVVCSCVSPGFRVDQLAGRA